VSGYIEAGYVVVLGALAAYTASLLSRERRAQRRLRRDTKPPSHLQIPRPPSTGTERER
jgi:hypothetical protein